MRFCVMVATPLKTTVRLRIDNSGRSVNYTIDHNSGTMLVRITFDIPNKRLYFSLYFHISVIDNKFDLIFL